VKKFSAFFVGSCFVGRGLAPAERKEFATNPGGTDIIRPKTNGFVQFDIDISFE